MSSEWLLKSNRSIQRYFIALLTINLVLGFIRFFLPFQVLNTGGSESLISSASALFAIGQVFSFLLLRQFLNSERRLFLAGNSFYIIFVVTISFSDVAWLIAVSRLIEGFGTGLMFLLIIKLVNQFESNKGEALGLLFGANFIGLASGQGMAGLINEILITTFSWPLITVTQNIARLSVVLLVITTMIGLPTRLKTEDARNGSHEGFWKHFHLSQLVKLVLNPGFILLISIYIFYDFAHGLYTPNLSILLNRNGIELVWLGFVYFAGDFSWGLTQIYSGRMVDKYGYMFPLVVSLLLKGLVVAFYPVMNFLVALTFLLIIAGIAEGFLEPARNKAALEMDELPEISHDHDHLLIAYSSGAGLQVSVHDHQHSHEMGSETSISFYQTTGIVAFAAGSLTGSVLLEASWSLNTLTWLGALFLITSSIVAILLRSIKRN
ncbi:MAG: MFS transporter [Candidatus Hodarchaeales archaeon]